MTPAAHYAEAEQLAAAAADADTSGHAAEYARLALVHALLALAAGPLGVHPERM